MKTLQHPTLCRKEPWPRRRPLLARSSASDRALEEGTRWCWQLATGAPNENFTLSFASQPTNATEPQFFSLRQLASPLQFHAWQPPPVSCFSSLSSEHLVVRRLFTSFSPASSAFYLGLTATSPGIWHHCRGCPALPDSLLTVWPVLAAMTPREWRGHCYRQSLVHQRPALS